MFKAWQTAGLDPAWRVVRVLRVWRAFKRLRAGKRQAWTPIRRHWCVALECLLAAGWSMPRFPCVEGLANGRLGPPMTGCKGFKGLEGFYGLRAGKRQAWTPIRRHWCVVWPWSACWLQDEAWQGSLVFKAWQTAGLDPAWRVVRVLRVWRVFKRLRAGKRQAWTPIRRHWCVALECLLAAGWSMPRFPCV